MRRPFRFCCNRFDPRNRGHWGLYFGFMSVSAFPGRRFQTFSRVQRRAISYSMATFPQISSTLGVRLCIQEPCPGLAATGYAGVGTWIRQTLGCMANTSPNISMSIYNVYYCRSSTLDPNDMLFPIPFLEIQTNPDLEQNPGN